MLLKYVSSFAPTFSLAPMCPHFLHARNATASSHHESEKLEPGKFVFGFIFGMTATAHVGLLRSQ